MFQSVGTSFRLTAASLRLIFRKPVTLTLPLLTLAWTCVWVIAPLLWWQWQAEHDPEGFVAFWKAVYFLPVQALEAEQWGWMATSAILTTYFLWALFMTVILTGALFVATVGMDVATQQIKTGDARLAPSFRLAANNLGRIFLLALTLATLVAWFRYLTTFVLRLIPFAGRWLNRAFRFVLSAVTVLMLPIVIYERAGPIGALKSAWRQVRTNWAGILVGGSLLYVAAWVLLNVLSGALFQGTLGLRDWTAVVPPIIVGCFLYAIASSSAAAMRATLYWYATTGEVPAGFKLEDLPKVQNPGRFTLPAVGAPGIVPVLVPAAAAPPVAPAASAPRPQAGQASAAPASAVATLKPKPAGKAAAKAAPAASASRGAVRHLACPKCKTVVSVAAGQKPACPACGHS